MKNKKLTYFLLLLVLVIWGSIAYQFIYTSPESEIITPEIVKNEFIHEIKTEDDTLLLNYRDPFLEKPNSKQKSKAVSGSNSSKKTSTAEKKVGLPSWPEVHFNGAIANSNSGRSTALLKINGREHLMKEGELKDGLEVSKIYSDSVVLAYMNYSKTVYK